MPRDAKPSEIELKRDDFSTPKQEIAAERLQKHWDSNCEFKKLAEELYPEETEEDDEPSASLYQKVYQEYFGVPGDRRTIEQLKAQYGSMSNYLEERKQGNVDLEFVEDKKTQLTDRELNLMQEGYKLARKELESELDREFDKGWDRALDMAEKVGLDEVPRMKDEESDEELEFKIRD